LETKLIEIRDRGTTIVAIAMFVKGKTRHENLMLERLGFWETDYILLLNIDDEKVTYDRWKWGRPTWEAAHVYLYENWDKIQPGGLIDLEYIRGESKTPKETEFK